MTDSNQKPLTNRDLIPSFWSTLFDDEDGTCFGKDKYGTQLYTVKAADPEHEVYRQLQYFSINPMKGDGRADNNVVKFRNFLVEFDKTSLDMQVKGVASVQMPYSTATFSGSKSIHYIISLEEPLPNREIYDGVVEWIYNILMPFGVDTQTKNPSRFSRVPGGTNVKRDDAGNIIRSKEQKLLKVKGRVPNVDLEAWLLSYPECQPSPKVYEQPVVLSETANPDYLSPWTRHLLQNGINNGKRNAEVFKMGFNFIEAGFSLEEAVSYFTQNAKHMGDFTFGEAELALESSYKTFARRGNS